MGKLLNLPYCKKCMVLHLFLILLELLDTYPQSQNTDVRKQPRMVFTKSIKE